MTFLTKFLKLASTLAFTALSPIVFAQSATISYAPTSSLLPPGAAPAPPVMATPVPTMTDGLLIALGLLLAVIAIRALKGQLVHQKILSVLLLGGGLLVGGLGVERSFATQVPVVPVANECEVGGTAALESAGRSDNKFTNSCEEAMTITAYSLGCGEAEEVEVTPVGTSIEPDETVSINYCQLPS